MTRRHVSPPPASPRKRRGPQWTPPTIGDYLIRDEDVTVWQVRNLDRASRMACLVAYDGTRVQIQWVHAGDLARDYSPAGEQQ